LTYYWLGTAQFLLDAYYFTQFYSRQLRTMDGEQRRRTDLPGTVLSRFQVNVFGNVPTWGELT